MFRDSVDQHCHYWWDMFFFLVYPLPCSTISVRTEGILVHYFPWFYGSVLSLLMEYVLLPLPYPISSERTHRILVHYVLWFLDLCCHYWLGCVLLPFIIWLAPLYQSEHKGFQCTMFPGSMDQCCHSWSGMFIFLYHLPCSTISVRTKGSLVNYDPWFYGFQFFSWWDMFLSMFYLTIWVRT